MELEKVVHTPHVLQEVAIQNDEFDLYEFFNIGNSLSYIKGACGFITRQQYFYCYARKYHSLVFENVCSSLFDIENVDPNYYYSFFNKYYDSKNPNNDRYDDSWRYANADLGVFSIQLLSKSSIFVWAPAKINSFQKETFLEFYNDVKQINAILGERGSSNINIYINVKQDGKKFKEVIIEDYVSHIDEYVDENCFTPHERLVSDYDYSKYR